MKIVNPVIVEPLLAEWAEARSPDRGRPRPREVRRLRRRRHPRPQRRPRRSAPPSSNASRPSASSTPPAAPATSSTSPLRALKDIEHRVNVECEALGLPRSFPAGRPRGRPRHRAQPLRRRARPRLGLDRRDPVDARQRLRRLPQPHPPPPRHHRMPRRHPEPRRHPRRLAGGGRGGRQPAVPRRQAHARQPRRRLRGRALPGLEGTGSPGKPTS